VLLELPRQYVTLVHRHMPPSPRVIPTDPRIPADVTKKERTMRVLVTGASGVIGTRLVTQLAEAGHDVVGTYRSAGHAGRIRAAGAEAIALDLLDPRAVRQAVLAAEPDAIINQATALTGAKFTRNLDRTLAETSRLRSEGTDALLAAAREAGVGRLVFQSFASMRYERTGPMVKTEDDPLDPAPLGNTRNGMDALRHLEEAVGAAGGVALRYGVFYGADNDGLVEPVRKRQFPIVGDGTGMTSWLHLDDAATATVLALESDVTGVLNVTDDEPAPVREWLPALAEALGAKPPRHVPRWLGKLLGGDVAVMMATSARGASNAKAKRELGWTLRHPSWREGFAAAYGAPREEPALR
jgi:nucleoside-diphosphate-sugar epimerase